MWSSWEVVAARHADMYRGAIARWPGYVGEVEDAASTGAVWPVRVGPVEAVRRREQTSGTMIRPGTVDAEGRR